MVDIMFDILENEMEEEEEEEVMEVVVEEEVEDADVDGVDDASSCLISLSSSSTFGSPSIPPSTNLCQRFNCTL